MKRDETVANENFTRLEMRMMEMKSDINKILINAFDGETGAR